ncbi:MAG: LacI family DNA-binding transcriptional regulator [Pseudomonadota bacterium]
MNAKTGRPTVHDIAREAGVSLATVDRVLNARPGVREKTIARVQEAVDRLGYVRDTFAANLARQRLYRFAFVLPGGSGQFVETLRAALREATASQLADRVLVRVVTVPANDPHAIVRALRALDPARLDGVALMVPETPQVRDAVARLKAAGLAVVALVSDLPNAPRDHFVGIDNVAAGRTAGLLMGRFAAQGGDVLVVTNSMRSRDSLERRLGFDQVISSEFKRLSVLPSAESFDDPARMAAMVAEVAGSRPGLAGVYSMGAGTSRVLEALGRTADPPRPVVIAHELTPVTRRGLVEGRVAAVIMQNVGHLVRSALRVMRTLCDRTPIFEAQERIRIEIVLRENIP